MYLANKYTKHYYSIINRGLSRATQVIDFYTENHHIIPKSLGGSNKKENLVKLTAREHFICHLLLIKMTEGKAKSKMVYAAYLLSRVKNSYQKRYKCTARWYERLKHKMIQEVKTRPGPNLGKRMSQEQKNKISASLKGKPKGPMSIEHRKKLSKPKTTEHKKKISESRTGKSWGYKHSAETLKKMSAWQKGKPKKKE